MCALFRSVMTGAGAVAILWGSVSCGEVARTGRSPALLVIDSLEAASGSEPDQLSGFLLSDVQTLVEQTVGGQLVMVPSTFNDIGAATLRIVVKDPGTGGLGVPPSDLNAITLRRYRIDYRRADGRNTPGVDVPFPVDGGVTGTITATPSTVGFEMVRHQAKLEPPLRSLVSMGGRLFISTIAEITFYGSDLAGNEVQATGSISVSFGDYADPE
jgi:hypothetical protein